MAIVGSLQVFPDIKIVIHKNTMHNYQLILKLNGVVHSEH